VKPLRIGIVGVGHLGKIHARLISRLETFWLVGVADPIEANRQQVADEYQTQAFARHEDLFGSVDAVVIATPTALHHQVAIEFLRRGVHTFVEKPLAGNSREATELVQAAREHLAVLQVGHVERFNPAWSGALPHVRDPKYIEAIRRSGYTFRSTDIGVVLDLMIHDLDLVLALVQSPVVRVEALGISIFGKHEDVANARLVFENGCIASLSASRAAQTSARTMHVWSQRALATLDFSARSATVVRPSETLLRREFDVDSLTPEQRIYYRDHLLAEHLPTEEIEPQPCDQITAELEDFAASIRAGRAPRVSGEQARDAVAVAEAILASIATHTWNGTADGPIGPLAIPAPRVIPGPHWATKPASLPSERREAG
jgi:predicted dehydrogenase